MKNVNINFKNFSHHQQGAITILLTTILLVTATFIVLFAAGYSLMQQKISANQYRNQQAFEAAEAGLEFGINYFQQNYTTITASTNNGYIQPYSDANTSNVSLPNNSKFTITYSNPTANNYNLILVTATGTSDDRTASRVVSQQIQFGSMLLNNPTNSITSKSTISLVGDSFLSNLSTNQNIATSSTASLAGLSRTITSSGITSTSGHLSSDIQTNLASISSLSTSDFFANYFGISSTFIMNNSTNSYSNNSSTNYNSQLNGLNGSTIWINQTAGIASLNGFSTIGSTTNPNLVMINGNLDLEGNATIYGLVYVAGNTVTLGENASVVGGIISIGGITFSGNSSLTYNPTVLGNLQRQPSLRYFAKVPGSWKDF